MTRDIIDINGATVSTMDVRETKHGHELIFSVWHDCEDVIKRCQAEKAADTFRGFRTAPTYRCVAELPMALFDIHKAQGIDLMNDEEALRKVLNDPAWAAFRCTEGKV